MDIIELAPALKVEVAVRRELVQRLRRSRGIVLVQQHDVVDPQQNEHILVRLGSRKNVNQIVVVRLADTECNALNQ